MQDDGNFVIYHGRAENDRSAAFWSTEKTDPLQSFDNISAFNYNLKAGHINSVKSVSIYKDHVTNNTNTVQSGTTINGSGSTTNESNWSDSITTSYGIKNTFGFEIPIGTGKLTDSIELSGEVSKSQTSGGSSTTTEEWQFAVPLSLEPHTSGNIEAQVQVATLTVPYTLTGVAHFQSGTLMSVTLDGTYMGSNSYNLEVTLNEDPSTGGKTPFRHVLATQKTPKTPLVIAPPELHLRSGTEVTSSPTTASSGPPTVNLPSHK